ncbi:hypothetical protein [Pseudoxanthomonas sp. Root630]|uniref:hypothetical protein n=1 Tax=Pseudoxanthomonas sp. Root630 TaxID=1736574 RepID=UPI0007025DF6|nr:hypothetical protein [Pseudoxanthomonas sp. Root630]KRA45189.1 hypothetical protein ASD72_07980 [Pseudoxanthomonas sp. Root630]
MAALAGVTGLVELLGIEMVALLAALAVAYFVVALMPAWWPALRAFRGKTRLPRPFLFVGVVAALVYGVYFLWGCIVLLPLEAYRIFIAPQLAAAGLPHGAWLVRGLDLVGGYGWLVAAAIQLVFTVWLTRRLARRWPSICAALSAVEPPQA